MIDTAKSKETSLTYKKKDGDNSVTYRVEQILNGFLVVKDTESKDEKGNYGFKCEKYYSKENPFGKAVVDKFDIMEKALRNNED